MVDFEIYGHRIKGVDNLGKTPARVYRDKKLILLNNQKFFKLPLYGQKIILLHELGHSLENTSNEFTADDFAFKNFVGSEPQSLKKTIRTLACVLPMKTSEQKQRFRKIVKKAAEWDVQNGNPNAAKILEKMKHNYIGTNSDVELRGLVPVYPNERKRRNNKKIKPTWKRVQINTIHSKSLDKNKLPENVVFIQNDKIVLNKQLLNKVVKQAKAIKTPKIVRPVIVEKIVKTQTQNCATKKTNVENSSTENPISENKLKNTAPPMGVFLNYKIYMIALLVLLLLLFLIKKIKQNG